MSSGEFCVACATNINNVRTYEMNSHVVHISLYVETVKLKQMVTEWEHMMGLIENEDSATVYRPLLEQL